MIVHQEDRIKRTRDTNEVEIKKENETYQTIQAYFLLLIISIMCYQSFINGNLEYDIVENGETLYGSSPYQKRNGTFVRLTLGYPFNRVIIYTVTSIMLLYSLISVRTKIHIFFQFFKFPNIPGEVCKTGHLNNSIAKNPEWSFPMIVLYLLDLVCDVSYSILAIYLFFRKFHLSTASIYTIVTLLMIAGEIWAWLGVLQLYEYRTYK